jgi:hypothetical protein
VVVKGAEVDSLPGVDDDDDDAVGRNADYAAVTKEGGRRDGFKSTGGRRQPPGAPARPNTRPPAPQGAHAFISLALAPPLLAELRIALLHASIMTIHAPQRPALPCPALSAHTTFTGFGKRPSCLADQCTKRVLSRC